MAADMPRAPSDLPDAGPGEVSAADSEALQMGYESALPWLQTATPGTEPVPPSGPQGAAG